MTNLQKKYTKIRSLSIEICIPLRKEDMVVQPETFVSPPKWHLGHTTWFFEKFILEIYQKDYHVFNEHYNFLFNSYYESAGERVLRAKRGLLTRPSVDEIMEYRKYVDERMQKFLEQTKPGKELLYLVELGLNHEQQHQELLNTDIKFILGHNPLFPAYENEKDPGISVREKRMFLHMKEGIYSIGYAGNEFSYDNELPSHKYYLNDFSIRNTLVSNAEYLDFINDGAYDKFQYWHAEAWEWLRDNNIIAPEYWHKKDKVWYYYTKRGLMEVDPLQPVCHISFYEAAAFAEWSGFRLATEFEWEAASPQFTWGERWEWTNSAYLPYPGFKRAEGAVGEYNGKFMVNQMVLRGASEATPPGHSRPSYRNFFHPWERWQFTGIRLAK